MKKQKIDLSSIEKKAYNAVNSKTFKNEFSKHEFIPAYITDCSNVIQVDENGKGVSRYCNSRFCITCNKIRTAKAMNFYAEQLVNLENPVMLTLTIPNCNGSDLQVVTLEMIKNFQQIVDNYRKVNGKDSNRYVRKLEVTYNSERNDFHPHFHILTTKVQAKFILEKWLKKNENANEKAQNITAINAIDKAGIYKEIFKYVTKLTFSQKNKQGKQVRLFTPYALKTILLALKGIRTFQVAGFKKQIDEDLKELQSQKYKGAGPGTYQLINGEYINIETGEMLNVNNSFIEASQKYKKSLETYQNLTVTELPTIVQQKKVRRNLKTYKKGCIFVNETGNIAHITNKNS